MRAGRPAVSVLIATRNRNDLLMRCLESVAGQDDPPFEILVLDDASDAADVCACVESRFKEGNIICARSDHQLGVGGARNRLMRQARGEYLVLLDDDAYFDDSRCLTGVVECFEQNPEVAAIALRIVESEGPPVRGLFPFSRRIVARQPEMLHTRRPCAYYLGAGHALRRSAAEEAGHYHEGSRWHHQDVDLSYRLIKLGYRLLYAGDLVVRHSAAPSVLVGPDGAHGELYYAARQRILFAWDHLPLRHAVVFLSAWCGYYSLVSIRRFSALEWLRGVADGLLRIPGRLRRPLNDRQLRYVRSSQGRLWY